MGCNGSSGRSALETLSKEKKSSFFKSKWVRVLTVDCVRQTVSHVSVHSPDSGAPDETLQTQSSAHSCSVPSSPLFGKPARPINFRCKCSLCPLLFGLMGPFPHRPRPTARSLVCLSGCLAWLSCCCAVSHRSVIEGPELVDCRRWRTSTAN